MIAIALMLKLLFQLIVVGWYGLSSQYNIWWYLNESDKSEAKMSYC